MIYFYYVAVDMNTFKLRLLPNPGTSEKDNNVGINVYVTYTSTYPDTAPIFKFEAIKGLNDLQVGIYV